jgi:predicted ATPase with chaperone activity
MTESRNLSKSLSGAGTQKAVDRKPSPLLSKMAPSDTDVEEVAPEVRSRQGSAPPPQLAQQVPAADQFEPPAPRSIEETGLSMSFLADLVIKTLYFAGYLSGYEVAEAVRLPLSGIVDRVLAFLKRERFIEIKGRGTGGGYAEAAYEYIITDRGSGRAREILERSQYAGAAPVTLSNYTDAMHRQSLKSVLVGPEQVRQALSHLIVNEKTLNQIGPAINSSRSIFLFGHPGNGKTTMSEAIGFMILQDEMYVPYAVEVQGQIIRVYDPVNFREAPQEETDQAGARRDGQRLDRRWLRVHRPVIIAGGELTLESLNLNWDEARKYYEAPLQMKANGGMFLIDDFGRQQARPRDLLNRWIVPLEKRLDYLTLQTGNAIEIPFDMLIIFATNLEPRDLVDEAFLRRIRHKIDVHDPTPDEYRKIFRKLAGAREIPYSEDAVEYLLREHYVNQNRELRACHPRDLLDQIADIARYRGVSPRLSKDLIDQACLGYFVDL